MFIAALFTIAKMWKQSKCPSTDEWRFYIYTYIYIHTHTHTYIHIYNIYTHTHIYRMEYYYAIKKNKVLPYATYNMDGPGGY